MKVLKIALLGGALMMSGSALAADPAATIVVPQGMFDWSGFYAGAEVGGTRVQATNLPGTVTFDGLLVDVLMGYNAVNDQLLYGIEADVGYSTAKYSGSCANANWTCKGYVDFQGTLRGRLGWVADNVLIYATGGLAVANIGGSTTSGPAIVPPNTTYPDSKLGFGYTVGGGVELALSDTLSGRVQYQYTNYGSVDLAFDIPYNDIAVDTHSVKLGILAHFN